jgi:hypothetical protein
MQHIVIADTAVIENDILLYAKELAFLIQY